MATFPLNKKNKEMITFALTIAALSVAVLGSIRYYNEYVILKKEGQKCGRKLLT